MLTKGRAESNPHQLPAPLWHPRAAAGACGVLARPRTGSSPGNSAQAVFRGSGSPSQSSGAAQGWDLRAGERRPGSSAETTRSQRFFEDSHFCILSVLREERFTAFSIDIFKSAACLQGKPRTEQFHFITHEDGRTAG